MTKLAAALAITTAALITGRHIPTRNPAEQARVCAAWDRAAAVGAMPMRCRHLTHAVKGAR